MNPLEKKLLDKKLSPIPAELESKLPELQCILIGVQLPGTPLMLGMARLELSMN